MQNRLHFPKIFQKTPQNTKITLLYPKKYDKHTYHFTMDGSAPPPRGLYLATSIAECSLKKLFPIHLILFLISACVISAIKFQETNSKRATQLLYLNNSSHVILAFLSGMSIFLNLFSLNTFV